MNRCVATIPGDARQHRRHHRPRGLACLIVCLALSAIVGCGGDDSTGNKALADRLFAASSTLEVLGSVDTKYCSDDSCTFGDDELVTTYQVNVLAPIEDVVNAFYAAYPGYDVYHEVCDGVECEGVHHISAAKGNELVYLIVYENNTGVLSADVSVPDVPTGTSG